MATENSSNINVTKDQELNSKNHVLKNSQVRNFQKDSLYVGRLYVREQKFFRINYICTAISTQ